MAEPLTSEDMASVGAAADELIRRGWTVRYSINQLINGWRDLVQGIERGYDMCVYELTNDLSIRGYAELVMELASPRVREQLHEALAPIDDRYRAATQPSTQRLPGAQDRWWGHRVPNVLVGELARDVRDLELLADQ